MLLLAPCAVPDRAAGSPRTTFAWPARALFSQLTDEEMLKAEPLLPLGALTVEHPVYWRS